MRILNLLLLTLLACILVHCKKEQATSQDTMLKQIASLVPKDNSYSSLVILDSIIYNTSANNKLYLGLLYFKKGNIYSSKREYSHAIESFEKAVDYFVHTNNQMYLLRSHLGLGISYSFSGNKALATEHLLKSLELSKSLKNKKREAQVYSMLAHTFLQYKDYEKAKDYTQKSIDLYKKTKDTVGLSETYNNLAIICKNQGYVIEALSYNLQSLELNQLNDDKSAIAKSYNNLGQVYKLVGDKHKATDYYQKAIEINKKNNIYNAGPLINMADYYIENKDISNAKHYYEKALTISFKTENFQIQKTIANKLLQISLQNKTYESSLKYQKMRDSLQLLQSKLETDEKLKLTESQYKLVSNRAELQQIKAINKKNKVIFISILISVIILGLWIWQRLKNNQLMLQQEKMSLEHAVLRSQMNPHFIFNALSAIQNSLFDNNPIQSASYISRFAKLIRQNFDFISQSKILLTDEIDALKNYLETQKIRFGDKFTYHINVDQNIDPEVVKIPPFLIQPLLENAIEHGFKGKKEQGVIDVKISKNGNKIQYEIIDNGKGFVSEGKDGKLHSLAVLKKRLKLLNLQDKDILIVQSSPEGTRIKFSLEG